MLGGHGNGCTAMVASCFGYYLSTLHLTIPYYKCWPSIYKLYICISASQNKKWFNVYWHVIYSCTQVQLSKSLFRVAQPPSGALVICCTCTYNGGHHFPACTDLNVLCALLLTSNNLSKHSCHHQWPFSFKIICTYEWWGYVLPTSTNTPTITSGHFL